MIMETSRGHGGISILLSGPNGQLLSTVKKIFYQILKLAYHLYLEKEFIYQNNKLVSSIKKNTPNCLRTYGDFSTFIDEKM